ncbi:MAG: TldD/PmbA family protein [Armatimonadetes bacterium]|nr:TldD/PmbA family protein [Armatimonadota bacterium]
MIGRDKVFGMFDQVLKASRADQTEAVLAAQTLALTRIADSEVHQNVEEDTARLTVRAWKDGGLGIASTSDLSAAGLRAVAERAVEQARRRSHAVLVPPLPGTKTSYPSLKTFHDSTAGCDEQARRILARALVEGAAPNLLAGNVRVGLQEYAVGNSNGLRAYAPLTYAGAVCVVRGASMYASGYGMAIHRDVKKIDFAAVARGAAETARKAADPLPIPRGDYQVVLDPPALSLILFQLSFRGLGSFGARAMEEGRSFVGGNLGQLIAAKNFSLYEDNVDNTVLPMPFDAEGSPKKRVALIENGKATGVVHDVASAQRAGTTSTGHAMPSPNHYGPVPISLVVPAGEVTREQLLRGMKRGLLITRAHGYVSPIDGKTGTMSGTTRDGTFLVENGEIVGPVHNVRWTASFLDAFKTFEGASKERSLQFTDELWFPSTNLLPSIRLGRLRINDVQPQA